MKYTFESTEIKKCNQCPFGNIFINSKRAYCKYHSLWTDDKEIIPNWCKLQKGEVK